LNTSHKTVRITITKVIILKNCQSEKHLLGFHNSGQLLISIGVIADDDPPFLWFGLVYSFKLLLAYDVESERASLDSLNCSTRKRPDVAQYGRFVREELVLTLISAFLGVSTIFLVGRSGCGPGLALSENRLRTKDIWSC